METITSTPFEPAWWLPNRHLQTLWPQFFHSKTTPALEEERVELPDGDFLDLCRNGEPENGIVLVFHGLEGSIRSPYARGIMNAIHKHGWCGIFMHFRGCGKDINRLERNYHSGDTGDIRYLIDKTHKSFPDIPLCAVAYSLGGNALLKYLGEYPQNPLSTAVAVSVPFLLNIGADQLDKGFSRVYQKHLISRLHRKMKKKYQGSIGTLDLNELSELNNFWRFDDRITAPLHGFENAEDYYSRSSCRQYLQKIETPTLILHALDDPFLTSEAIPNPEELSSSVKLELTNAGGHVGFISGKTPWSATNWLEKRIPEHLQAFLGNH